MATDFCSNKFVVPSNPNKPGKCVIVRLSQFATQVSAQIHKPNFVEQWQFHDMGAAKLIWRRSFWKWPMTPTGTTSIVNLQDFWGGESDNPLPKKFMTASRTIGPTLLSTTREMAKKRFNAMGRKVSFLSPCLALIVLFSILSSRFHSHNFIIACL